jgi:hypothetical protein
MAFRNSIFIIAAVVVAVTILISTNFGAGRTVIYDCRLAEFHPDFPLDVREQCRELLRDQLSNKKITT